MNENNQKMKKEHFYSTNIIWTGNKGAGTQNYLSYERSYSVASDNKPFIACSSDPAFKGDKSKYNPEELFVASISSCHMLWYLHLCAESGIIVEEYNDSPKGIMHEFENGSGCFNEVILNPKVKIKDKKMEDKALLIHHKAHQFCFIANSCNFPIIINATIIF